MGFLDFLFPKVKKKEPEINYEEIILNCWNIFREGLKNPNPEIRKAVEQAVWFVDSPEGKRYFATGMQEPDISNKIFCLKKLYERGGWRLAENLIKIALNDDSVNLKDREEILYFIGGFSDPNAADYLIDGLKNPETEIRIATLCALSGVKGTESANKILEHLNSISDEMEKFACGLALYQFNKPEGKKLLDEAFTGNAPKPEYLEKLKYIDFAKAKPYYEQFSKNENPEVKKIIISHIEDNRGIDLIKLFLNDNDISVANRAIEQVIELGSRSALEIIKGLKDKPGLEKNAKLALAVFGDKNEIEELENKVRKGSLESETLDDLKVLGLIHEQDVSQVIDKLLLPIGSLDNCSDEELDKINKAMHILIKYGKMSSILPVSRYCQIKYLEKEDVIRWVISCYAAAAILCIVERNTTYYTLRKKMKEEQGQ